MHRLGRLTMSSLTTTTPTGDPKRPNELHHVQVVDAGRSIANTGLNRRGNRFCCPDRCPTPEMTPPATPKQALDIGLTAQATRRTPQSIPPSKTSGGVPQACGMKIPSPVAERSDLAHWLPVLLEKSVNRCT